MRLRRPATWLVLALAGTATSGCVSVPTLKKWSRNVVGHDIAVLRWKDDRPDSYESRLGWRETTYPLDNGHWVFIKPVIRNCEVHFEVDGNDTVVGWEPVGRGCRYL